MISDTSTRRPSRAHTIPAPTTARDSLAYRVDPPHQIRQHVRVVDANLQHDAARHAGRLIAPGAEIDLTEAVTADIGLGIDQSAQKPDFDLPLDPSKLTLPPPLVANAQ